MKTFRIGLSTGKQLVTVADNIKVVTDTINQGMIVHCQTGDFFISSLHVVTIEQVG